MAGLKAYTLCIFAILSLTNSCVMASSGSQAVGGAYWPSSAFDTFPPSAIEISLFTHIYYAFLMPNNITFKFDITNSTALILVNFTSTLHSSNPPLKTLFSIAADKGTEFFSRMSSNSSSRKVFIDSAIEVARKFGFDGIDLDWEYPRTQDEMENFGILLHEWRAEVEKEAVATSRPPLLLSAATYFAVDIFINEVYRSYPVGSVSENLDWINAMCYDYRGWWDTSATGAHAALYDPKSNVSTSYGLRSWIKAGFPGKKLIMGLPLYGRSWKLKDPMAHGVGAPAVGLGPGELGEMTYSEVEKFNRETNATVVYDLATISTYSVAGTSWIGYDDVRSTTVKIMFAQALGLRGYFFWAVNGDHEWKISKAVSSVSSSAYESSKESFVTPAMSDSSGEGSITECSNRLPMAFSLKNIPSSRSSIPVKFYPLRQ
ncbi:hypothetical protein RJ640_009466 [Escallonia rubra]|uniref:GH18 domain-containing protein n=1 Tax=Escallonia rubra TaxID=112253 RepID=A0AA88S2B6_9ASTE|nr:hypothetical protein RJ640_009466 [Escallonia rubra]